MLNLLLDAAYLLFLIAASPWIVYRRVVQKKPIAGLLTKLTGQIERRYADRPCLWFHAVSVGEVLQLRAVLERMRSHYPQHEFVITTTTGTGFDVARQKYSDCTVQYFPFDFSWAVREAMAALEPQLIVLVELELWPNFLSIAKQCDIPVAIINGRISDKSYQAYRRVKWLTRPLLQSCSLVCAQNQTYAERFLDLGAAPSRVFETGNIKFDGLETNRHNPQTEELRRHFEIRPHELVFVAGSTQAPEEEFALSTWESLCQDEPSLRLLLVPRHKERFEEVAALIQSRGHQFLRRSKSQESSVKGQEPNHAESALARSRLSSLDSRPVLLLDTLGELSKAWGLADIAFVGGSLTDRGGQNMIEPAGYGAAVLFGPNTWNFRDVTEALLSRNAAQVVHNSNELTQSVRKLLADESARKSLGGAARQFASSQQGAADLSVSLLSRLISPGTALKTHSARAA